MDLAEERIKFRYLVEALNLTTNGDESFANITEEYKSVYGDNVTPLFSLELSSFETLEIPS